MIDMNIYINSYQSEKITNHIEIFKLLIDIIKFLIDKIYKFDF